MPHAAEGSPSRQGVLSRATHFVGAALRRLLHEPLLQFLLFGAALFAIAHVVEEYRISADRQILVDESVLHRLAKLYELQMGSQPSPQRLESLVGDYVRDEVMYREALKMGIDQDDEIIRRRMIQKLEFLNRDLTVVPEPTETQLQDYFAAHQDQFTVPAAVSFTHVYFSPDVGGSAAARQRALAALHELQAGKLQRAPELGDRFPLQYDYALLNRLEVGQVFGQTELTDALLSVPAQQWSGPYESGYGWHLIYVGKHADAYVPPFAQIRDKVRENYLSDARDLNNRKKFEELKARYEVIRTASAAPAAGGEAK
jgi:hypothetical protein